MRKQSDFDPLIGHDLRSAFSRMIWTEMTPTEANYIAGALMALLLLDRDYGILDDEAGKRAVADHVDRIDRQLERICWPKRKPA